MYDQSSAGVAQAVIGEQIRFFRAIIQRYRAVVLRIIRTHRQPQRRAAVGTEVFVLFEPDVDDTGITLRIEPGRGLGNDFDGFDVGGLQRSQITLLNQPGRGVRVCHL